MRDLVLFVHFKVAPSTHMDAVWFANWLLETALGMQAVSISVQSWSAEQIFMP